MDRVNVRNSLNSVLFVPLSLSLHVCLFYLQLQLPLYPRSLANLYLNFIPRCENRTNGSSHHFRSRHLTRGIAVQKHGEQKVARREDHAGCLAKNRVFLAAAGVPTGVRISRNAVCIFSLGASQLHAFTVTLG